MKADLEIERLRKWHYTLAQFNTFCKWPVCAKMYAFLLPSHRLRIVCEWRQAGLRTYSDGNDIYKAVLTSIFFGLAVIPYDFKVTQPITIAPRILLVHSLQSCPTWVVVVATRINPASLDRIQFQIGGHLNGLYGINHYANVRMCVIECAVVMRVETLDRVGSSCIVGRRSSPHLRW